MTALNLGRMDILKGLLYINEDDVYERYGAFLSENKAGEYKNYSALMKPSASKSHVAVNFREHDGERYPEKLLPALDARDVVLQFAICAPDKESFFLRYHDFVQMLRNGNNGFLNIKVPELNKTYRMIYLSCSEWEQLTDFGNEVAARFSVKFREPSPEF